MSAPEFSRWQLHDGRDCPIAPDSWVEVRTFGSPNLDANGWAIGWSDLNFMTGPDPMKHRYHARDFMWDWKEPWLALTDPIASPAEIKAVSDFVREYILYHGGGTWVRYYRVAVAYRHLECE